MLSSYNRRLQILFHRTAIAQLKTDLGGGGVLWGGNGMPLGKNNNKKTAVPFDHVTVLLFLVHRMPRTKEYKKN